MFHVAIILQAPEVGTSPVSGKSAMSGEKFSMSNIGSCKWLSPTAKYIARTIFTGLKFARNGTKYCQNSVLKSTRDSD